MLSIVIGIASGLAAVVIKNSVHFIRNFLTEGFAHDYHNYLYFAYPLIGILITVSIIRYLLRRPVGHGIPSALFAISKRSSIMPRNDMFSSIITSAFTVGFGGSAGLEGPTVATGAAIGSNIGRWFRLNYKTKTLLIGCAAAGAMAAIFKAPIAAIIFALEVIMLDLTMASLIPLLLASVSAALTSRFFLGEDVLFHFPVKDVFHMNDLPFFALLGVVAGLISVYFSKVYFYVSASFEKIKNAYLRVIVSGILLGGLIFCLPALYGEGYETINALIEGDYTKVLHNSPFYSLKDNFYIIMGLLIAVMLLKVVATSITFGGGGIAGIFASVLFMGSTTGFIFSKLFNHFKIASLSESNFTLVGMAGLMGGVLYAPLTAIFLIAEITGGYELFIPLMITSALAYLTSKYFIPHSVYTKQLAKRGELITHHKDQAVLTLMKLQSEIEKDFEVIDPDKTLGDLVKVVAKSDRNIYPVVDEDNIFLGMVKLNDIREVMFNQKMYSSTYVRDIMSVPTAYISPEDSMDEVMKKFEKTGAWNLPVVEEDKYVGFVSKSKLFSAYRKLLRDFYEE